MNNNAQSKNGDAFPTIANNNNQILKKTKIFLIFCAISQKINKHKTIVAYYHEYILSYIIYIAKQNSQIFDKNLKNILFDKKSFFANFITKI